MSIKIGDDTVNSIVFNDGTTNNDVYKVVKDGTPVWCKKYSLDISSVKSYSPGLTTSYDIAWIYQITTDEPSAKLNPESSSYNKLLATIKEQDVVAITDNVYFDDVLRITICNSKLHDFPSATYDGIPVVFTAAGESSTYKKAIITVKNAGRHAIIVTNGPLIEYHFKLYNDTGLPYYIKNWQNVDLTIYYGDVIRVMTSETSIIQIQITHTVNGTSDLISLSPPDSDTYNYYEFDNLSNLRFTYRDSNGSIIDNTSYTSPTTFLVEKNGYLSIRGLTVKAIGYSKVVTFSYLYQSGKTRAIQASESPVSLYKGDRITRTTSGMNVYVGDTSAIRKTITFSLVDSTNIASAFTLNNLKIGSFSGSSIPTEGSGSSYEVLDDVTICVDYNATYIPHYITFTENRLHDVQAGTWSANTITVYHGERKYVHLKAYGYTSHTVEVSSSQYSGGSGVYFDLYQTSTSYTYMYKGIYVNNRSIAAESSFVIDNDNLNPVVEVKTDTIIRYNVVFSESYTGATSGSWSNQSSYNTNEGTYIYVRYDNSAKTVVVKDASQTVISTFTLYTSTSQYTFSMSGCNVNGTAISANEDVEYILFSDLTVMPVTSCVTKTYNPVIRAIYRTSSSTNVIATKSLSAIPYGTVINSDSSQVRDYFRSNNNNAPICWYPSNSNTIAYYDPEYYDVTVTSTANYDIINYQSKGDFTFDNAQFYQYDYQQDLWQASCVITNTGNAAISVISVYFFEFQFSTGGSDTLISKTTIRNLAAGVSNTFISNDYVGRGYKSAHIVAYITYATRTCRDDPQQTFAMTKQTETRIYGPYDRSTNLADYIEEYYLEHDGDYNDMFYIYVKFRTLPAAVNVSLEWGSYVETSSAGYNADKMEEYSGYGTIPAGTSGWRTIFTWYGDGCSVEGLYVELYLSASGYTSTYVSEEE